ncbi:hypothetical protein AYO21_08532 [Fonsecaea monophora]|uniref:Uncharacterized protein n=1 Tax=Fonsecaea monophora TaxID=254056 RepID=A0A177EYV5_9EURO|nr:hypothetical protein AYO21_08532 [Fonsecaea monophora]OAG37233.1 hypothetical protein AYO21_08532 [Fonsecaea monophora]
MSLLSALGWAPQVLCVTLVGAAVGVKAIRTVAPDVLYTRIGPFLQRLAQSRALVPVRWIYTGVQVAAYLVVTVYRTVIHPVVKWPACILLFPLRWLFEAFQTTALIVVGNILNLVPTKWVYAVGNWLFESNGVFENHRFGVCLAHSLFPCVNNGPAKVLFSLSDHIARAAEAARRDDMKRSILERYKNAGLSGADCSTRTSDRVCQRIEQARRVLLAANTDLRALLTLATPDLRTTYLQGRAQTKRKANNPWRVQKRRLRTKMFQMPGLVALMLHYTRLVKSTAAGRCRIFLISTSIGALGSFGVDGAETRNPDESIYSEGIKELLSKNIFRHWIIDIPDRATAWHLHRDEGSAQITIDSATSAGELSTTAAGVRLTDEQLTVAGHTFVSNEYIHKVMALEKERRRLAGDDAEVYEIFFNNCQTLWTNGMLDLLMCKCAETDRESDRLLSIEEAMPDRDWHTSVAELGMSFPIALGRRGYLPMGLWVRWVSNLVCVLQELNYYAFGPALYGLDLTFGSNRLRGFSLLAMLILHPIFVYKYHGTLAPSPFEWADLGVGLVAGFWVRSLRTRTLRQTPVQPPGETCWSGYFSQLYEKSENGEIEGAELDQAVMEFLRSDYP